jgi:hypothetical protein
MGTDINIYLETNRNGKWEPIPEPTVREWSKGKKIPVDDIRMMDSRPYQLFAALAGVCQDHLRHTLYAVVEPIAEPRGLPDDMNDLYKQYFSGTTDFVIYPSGNRFGHTWLMLQEIIDYDWDGQFVTQWAYVKNEFANLFQRESPFPEAFPNGEEIYFVLPNRLQEPGTTEVSWMTSYRDYVGCSEAFIEELLKFGFPNEIRVIFWFDN